MLGYSKIGTHNISYMENGCQHSHHLLYIFLYKAHACHAIENTGKGLPAHTKRGRRKDGGNKGESQFYCVVHVVWWKWEKNGLMRTHYTTVSKKETHLQWELCRNNILCADSAWIPISIYIPALGRVTINLQIVTGLKITMLAGILLYKR